MPSVDLYEKAVGDTERVMKFEKDMIGVFSKKGADNLKHIFGIVRGHLDKLVKDEEAVAKLVTGTKLVAVLESIFLIWSTPVPAVISTIRSTKASVGQLFDKS
ncbi:unnamed protein product, partial [marine sediment metagenome]